VTEVKNGDRVAYAMISGSYAEYSVVPALKLAPVPSNLDSKIRGRIDASRHDRALSNE
jgi:NADPH:quinone reductase-like Zn-dependent oxidoreductase